MSGWRFDVGGAFAQRKLDPHTGDEAGTVEGDFAVHWCSDYFFGHNLAIASENNFYLDGLGAVPERASRDEPARGDGASGLPGAAAQWTRQPCVSVSV